MKKPASQRKLSLHREALRHLDDVQLTQVIGGVSLPGNPCGTQTHDPNTIGQ